MSAVRVISGVAIAVGGAALNAGDVVTIAGPGLERTDQAQLGATKRAYGLDRTWCTLLLAPTAER